MRVQRLCSARLTALFGSFTRCLIACAFSCAFALTLAFALALAPAPAFADTYEGYGSKVINAVEMGGDEDNIRLAHAACTVAYSRRVWHGGGYDGTDLWMDVFHDTLPGNKWVRACEVNVAAIVRWTGIDLSYPVYAGKLMSYAKTSSKWDYLGYWDEDESKLLPGDILAYYGGTVNGKKIRGLHVCMYVGEDIVNDVYKAYVKGTDGDVGKPVSGAKYVSAHSGGSLNNKQNGIGGSGAPCMDTARTSYARGIYHKGLYQIIRLKGAVSSEASKKAIAARKTIDDGIYKLSLASKSKMKLDVKSASKKSGAATQLNSSKQRASQRWRFTFTPDGYYRIVNVASGKSLSIAGGKAKSKAKVVQKGWKNAKSQKWCVVKKGNAYVISSALNKKYVLHPKSGKKKSGTSIRLYKRSTKKALSWKLSAAKPGIAEGAYVLTNKKSNLSLSTPATGVEFARQVTTSTDSGSQQWVLAYDQKTGYYTMQNVRSGMYLAAKDGGVKQVAYESGKVAQQWYAAKKGSAWVIRNASTGKALAISKGSKKANAKAALMKASNAKAPRWNLVSVEAANVPPTDSASSTNSSGSSSSSDASGGNDLTVVTI